MTEFKVGDRVRRVKPYRAYGGQRFERYDVFTTGEVVGLHGSGGATSNSISVRWDRPRDPDDAAGAPRQLGKGSSAWVDPECLEPEIPPPTEEEVHEAIVSIMGHMADGADHKPCPHISVSMIYAPPAGIWLCDQCGTQFVPREEAVDG